MGRPLNKRFFGPATAGGNEIKVDFYDGISAVKEGYIVKQLGSKKFRVAAIGTPGTTYDRFLTTGKLASALTGTEMAITMLMDDSETYQVSKISGRKATLVAPDAIGTNTHTGKSVPWNFTVSTSDGAAQVEEAGDDDTLVGVDDDDFANA
jgi:hypothetical protein